MRALTTKVHLEAKRRGFGPEDTNINPNKSLLEPYPDFRFLRRYDKISLGTGFKGFCIEEKLEIVSHLHFMLRNIRGSPSHGQFLLGHSVSAEWPVPARHALSEAGVAV